MSEYHQDRFLMNNNLIKIEVEIGKPQFIKYAVNKALVYACLGY